MSRSLAAAAACLALASCAVETTPEPAPDPVPASATPQLWFVELEAPAVTRGGALRRVQGEHVAFLGDAQRLGIRIKEEHRFATLWNGLSVWVAPADVPRLFGAAGVTKVFPVLELAPPVGPDAVEPPPAEPDLATSIGMIGADVARNELGFTGAGVRVAVIDTGIDWNHPDLGNCFGAGCRVAFGVDLVGDDFNAGVAGSLAIPDENPDDCAGHGTHVAGIVGAGGVRPGVAPGVTFGAYRVFGCLGSTRADIMIAAMEAAYADDMRVINMSIGSSFTWPEYPTATAVTNLVNNGVVVAASIGNSGTAGLYAAGAPGVGTDTIGVASIENTMVTQPAFRVDPHVNVPPAGLIGFSGATGAPLQPATGTFPLVRNGTIATTNDACDPLPAGSLANSIVVVRRGGCTFHVKAVNVQAAGAVAAVLYNNVPGALSPTVTGATPITIPIVAISGDAGIALNLEMDAGPVTLTWTDAIVSAPNPVAGQVSGFSSWGPTANLTFKPDLAAPGGLIYSTYPIEKGRYASLSGTSMASPHVAGAAALLLQARPGLSPQQVQVLLENTAVAAIHVASTGPEPTQREGAGLIRVDRAIQSPAMVTPPSLALGESTAGPQTRTLTVTNLSAAPIIYDLSHRAAASVTGTTWAPVVSMTAAATVTTPATITVAAGATTSFDVTITADPAAAQATHYGGFVLLTPQGGGQVLSVPYQGFVGDYQATVIMPPGTFPTLARSANGTTFTNLATGTFTLEGTSFPYLRIHFDHFARRLIVDVEDTTGKPIGVAFDEDFLSHGDTAASAINLRWDGTVLDKDPSEVDSGDYRLRVRVLKPLGDAGNPAHWETWTSGVLTLDRP